MSLFLLLLLIVAAVVLVVVAVVMKISTFETELRPLRLLDRLHTATKTAHCLYYNLQSRLILQRLPKPLFSSTLGQKPSKFLQESFLLRAKK